MRFKMPRIKAPIAANIRAYWQERIEDNFVMYLRRHGKKIEGEEYTYWLLVESISTQTVSQ